MRVVKKINRHKNLEELKESIVLIIARIQDPVVVINKFTEMDDVLPFGFVYKDRPILLSQRQLVISPIPELQQEHFTQTLTILNNLQSGPAHLQRHRHLDQGLDLHHLTSCLYLAQLWSTYLLKRPPLLSILDRLRPTIPPTLLQVKV